MSAFWKTVAAIVVGGIFGGGAPTIVGGDVKTIGASAVAGVAIALFHLWQEKPQSVPAK